MSIEEEVATTNEPKTTEEVVVEDSSLKRKLDESEDATADVTEGGEDPAKKAKSEDADSGASDLPEGHINEIIECVKEKVGQIIGSKGAIIQDIQTRTGVKAFINQDFPDGVPRQVNITGLPAQVKAAADLVNLIIKEGPQAIHVNMLAGGPTMTSVVECSQPQVGKIIGAGGSVIKDIQAKSGSRIQIDQSMAEGLPRKVNITGTQSAVMLAITLVNNAMNAVAPQVGGGMGMGMGGPGPAVTSMGDGKQVMDLPKIAVGKIIGKGGENIQMIQRISGARLNIEQDQDPCKVNMTGAPQSLAIATQMITEATNGVPLEQVAMNAQRMAGGGGMGGAMGGMGMGGYGAMQQPMGGMQYGNPMAQPSPYGGGYGGYPQQQQAQAYGQQSYGQQPAAAASAGGYQPQAGGYAAQAAPAQATAKAASVWTEHKTDDGVPYWYNASTGVSQWERPKN